MLSREVRLKMNQGWWGGGTFVNNKVNNEKQKQEREVVYHSNTMYFALQCFFGASLALRLF